MNGEELKTDSWHRYMLYRGDERYMTFEPEEKRKEAVEAGKKFTASAYADVWAKDAELVKRVRVFLGENFHWHERLAKGGADLDVVQTLMDMVRGGSVVVIPEKPVFSGGGIAWPPEKPACRPFGASKTTIHRATRACRNGIWRRLRSCRRMRRRGPKSRR